jgi:hypothetical protein
MLILFLALALAACNSTNAPAVAGAPTPTYGLAGQSVFIESTRASFANTEAAFNAAVANATANAAATVQANNAIAFAVATGVAIRETDTSFGRTQLAVTVSANETMIGLSVMSNAATAAPGQTSIAATATAVTIRTKERSDNFYWWVMAIFWSVFCTVGLFYFWRAVRALSRRVDPANDPANVRALRLPSGTVLIIPLPGGGIKRELIALPGASPIVQDIFDTDDEPGEEPDEIPVHGPNGRQAVFSRSHIDAEGEANERHRRAALRFLTKAIEANGQESGVIPRYDKMNVSAETWKACTALVGDQLEKRQGRHGGTFLVGKYETLGELTQAIGERRYIPRMTVDVKHSPAPTRESADEATA